MLMFHLKFVLCWWYYYLVMFPMIFSLSKGFICFYFIRMGLLPERMDVYHAFEVHEEVRRDPRELENNGQL